MNQTISKFLSILLLVVVLSTSFISTNKVEAFIHENIPVGQIVEACITRFVAQEAAAWISGLAVMALSATPILADTISVPASSFGQTSVGLLQSGQGTKLSVQQYLKQAADCAAHAASRVMIQAMNDKTRAWIRQGLDGFPLHTPNLERLLNDLAQMPANELRRQVDGFALCDFDGSFRNRLGNSIVLSTRQNARQKFAERVRCPFPNAQGRRAQDFFGGTYLPSSFASGFEASLQPAGNPWIIAFETGIELDTRTDEVVEVKKQQLAQSKGYSGVVDTKNCTFPPGLEEQLLDEAEDGVSEALAQARRIYCKTTTPGDIVGEQLADAVKSDMAQLINSGTLTRLIEGFIKSQLNAAMKGILK